MNRSPLLSGLMYSFVWMLIGTLLSSLILYFSRLPESSWLFPTFIVHGAAIGAGGFISGKRSGSRGWYHGAMLGLMYFLIVWIIGFLAYDTGVSAKMLYLAVLSLSLGALGGIIGINVRKK